MASNRRQRIRNAFSQNPKLEKPPVYTMNQLKKSTKKAGLPNMCSELKAFWRKALVLSNQYYSDGRRHAMHGFDAITKQRFVGRLELHTECDDTLTALLHYFYRCYTDGYNSVQHIDCDQEEVAA